MHEPSPQTEPMVIELVVQNHPGVMVHIAGLFARRAFNLEGILCGPIADGLTSHMLLLVGAEARTDQVLRQLEKLQDVIEAQIRPDVPKGLFQVSTWSDFTCRTPAPAF